MQASTGERSGSRAIMRGDVYWLDAAADKDAALGIPHPHLVVQDDIFNHSRIATVVVCALTSNLQKAHEPGNVLLDEGEGDLPSRSVVVVSQISSIAKQALRQYIGSLSAARVDQVVAGLRFLQRSYFER